MDKTQLLLVVTARRMAADGEAAALRLAACLSLREVAEALCISHVTLWRWEQGKRAPRGQAAAAWGQLLGELQRSSKASAAREHP